MAGKNKPTCVSGLISTDAWGALISVFSIFSWRWPYEVPDIYFSICVFEGLLYRKGREGEGGRTSTLGGVRWPFRERYAGDSWRKTCFE